MTKSVEKDRGNMAGFFVYSLGAPHYLDNKVAIQFKVHWESAYFLPKTAFL